MDMGNLLTFQFPDCSHRAPELRELGLVTGMRRGGVVLYEEMGLGVAEAAADWESDTVRGWAAMAIGHAPELSLAQRLELLRPFGGDAHFAVREWAWLSARPHVVEAPETALELLQPWTTEESPNLRRFASEVTRPRGVWSTHIPLLKLQPERALGLLTALRADPSRYVQDSVANWLNDASKTRPGWVEDVRDSWLAGTPSESTTRICRRACRSLARASRARAPESLPLAP
ncbi:MAG: hypothetical protein QOF13_2247 [Solirubrobacterales bacterium]|nr:hypothetical protein [Solirubrobacterales bacterium]